MAVGIRAVLVAVAGAGCMPAGGQTVRFELAPGPPGRVFSERRSYFLSGLLPTASIDVSAKCPYGAAAIEDGVEDGAGWVPSLGLWTRRTTTYHCRAAPAPASAP